MAFVYISEYEVIEEKPFTINGYYKGVAGEREDPKQTYLSYISGSSNMNNSCTEVPSISDKAKMTPSSAVWVVDGEVLEESSTVNKKDDDELAIMPFKDGDNILAPASLVFTNSNMLQSSEELLTIKATIGDNILIEFVDVKTWWCHIGKESEKHTKLLGKDGDTPAVSIASIIGQAKASTYINVYKLEDGTYKKVDALKYFTDGHV